MLLRGGYADFGDTEGKIRESDSITYSEYASGNYDYNYKINIDAKTKMLGISLTSDITKKFYTGIRAGSHLWETEYEEKENYIWNYKRVDFEGRVVSSFSDSISDSDKDENDGSDLYYGVFIGWNYNNWSVSLAHTIFEMDERRPSLSSLGLTYNF
ncbi:hypothetical protein [Microbulbifer sp. JMSA008]|uniref:hypothetical protein n=1 Tax=Microbulbifer sp. JMSA008 TaxID=3243373 RepID=UPI004039437F